MNKKKLHWWIRFGCFLSGWNKNILRNCSEHSFKKLKRITAAMIIISLIWFFVAFKFATLYLKIETIGAIIAGLIGVIMVIQIERQIVLHVTKTRRIRIIRFFMALLMAVIGSIIIDQVIFKDDIALAREDILQKRVNKIVPNKQLTLDTMIQELRKDLNKKENEYQKLQSDIQKNPKIKMYNRVAKTETIIRQDSLGREIRKDTTIYKYEFEEVANPKFKDLEIIRKERDTIKNKILSYQQKKISVREDTENELKSKNAFLDELNIMVNEILLKNPIALAFWLILFAFLTLLELLVLFASMGICDYEAIVMAQKKKYSPPEEDMK